MNAILRNTVKREFTACQKTDGVRIIMEEHTINHMPNYNIRHTSDRFFRFCGILMLISEIWKQYCLTYIVNNGTYNWWYFPFQLCSIPMYVCLLIPFSASSKIRGVLLAFLMDFGLLGGIFTFFDTTGMHYSYRPLTIHSFAWHILLIIIGVYAGLCRASDHSLSGFAKCTCLFLVCCLAATLFNLAFHPYGQINMFYISPYHFMGQIVFRDIAGILGNTAGILIYILSIIIGAGLLHLSWKRVTF